jgi:hypothetical protein
VAWGVALISLGTGYFVGGSFWPILAVTVGLLAVLRGHFPNIFASITEAQLISGIPSRKRESVSRWLLAVTAALIVAIALSLLYRKMVPQKPNLSDLIRSAVQEAIAKVAQPPPNAQGQAASPPKTRPTNPKARELKLIFKESPIFTAERKEDITNQMELFYDYLVRVGFDPPREVAPLGVAETASGGGVFPGPAYWAQLIIAEKSIDNPLMIHNAYARFAFPLMLNAWNPGAPGWQFRMPASWVCIGYYVDSFDNKQPRALNTQSVVDPWLGALWDIRMSFGSSFADRTLFYAVKSFDDEGGTSSAQEARSFRDYFVGRILFGETVLDNQFKNYEGVTRILEARGLLRPE